MKPKHGQLSRRDLIKRFGALAFVLTPVARAMGYVAGGSFAGAPRFVMFFRGGSFHPPSVRPATIQDLGGTPLAPLAPHASDLVLFKNMRIHGGSPKTDGYQEEHGAGLYGCVTGNRIRYTQEDSYYAYTDHESIDVTIANHYKSRPELAALPFASLHVGGGAHADADDVGLGQRYISYRARRTGDTTYGNAIEPIQNTGQVYMTLMQRINLLCTDGGTTPPMDTSAQRAALLRKQSLLDFHMEGIADAKRTFGMDSEHSAKLDGMLDGWREVEKVTTAELAALDAGGGGGGTTDACPAAATYNLNGTDRYSLDTLGPVHDQMISLIRLAFEWDLTRVVAFTLSGASSGATWPSQGVTEYHHKLEHNNNVAKLNVMGTYYAGKFAKLLTELKAVRDPDGNTMLHNSSVILGMECWSDSVNGHYLTDIPFVFAGNGGGRFQTGRIVDAAQRSNNDLLVSVQQAAGIESNTFGLASLCTGPIL